MRTLVWDIDDTLNQLTKKWLEHKWKIDHPECLIPFCSLFRNPPHEILGCSLEKYLESLDDYRKSLEISDFLPYPEVLAWFMKHGNAFHHVALTSTPGFNVPAASKWLFNHFGAWFRSFHFVPSRRKNDSLFPFHQDKAEYLKWLGRGDVLIDDSTEHIEKAGKLGIKTILFPQPWNSEKRPVQVLLEGLLEES